MAFISTLFYGPGFLKSHIGQEAAFNDLTSILQLRQLRQFMPEVAGVLLSTWDRHLDYLSPQLIVLGLLSKFEFKSISFCAVHPTNFLVACLSENGDIFKS